MINRQALLADLQTFLQLVEADLLDRSESTEVPEVPAALRAEYEKAAKAERTAQNYEDWRTDTITQAAAAWVLSCVFVRFLEDNSLIDPPKIAGPGDRLARARDEHELYFRSYPQHTDREYLLSIFDELVKLPGTKGIFGEHNAVNDLPNWLSGDAAGELLSFFQKIDANTGALIHDFTDPTWDTRFLGDLYQDLSESARKKFALLQTPDFVEEFILDRTLEPAIEEFGLSPRVSDSEPQSSATFKMIDPACGSGHFLLGAFPRLLDRWQRKEPGTNIRELTQRALNSIHGVDINPYAVAIARFRLLLAATKACAIGRLSQAPGFQINVICGDSLLHAPLRTGQQLLDFELISNADEFDHVYNTEDLQLLKRTLAANQYHAVVANPPYIIVRDAKVNKAYRQRYSTCAGKYSLAVPFLERCFRCAVPGGFVGQITTNAFMKRKFGKVLVESYLPSLDLFLIVDASGAYIPGHGTPTVLLFGRNQKPISTVVRCVRGLRAEPETPAEPARGLVWSEIESRYDSLGFSGGFIEVSDVERRLLGTHPWSIAGGGAAELREELEESADTKLSERATIGIGVVTLEDDAFAGHEKEFLRLGIADEELVRFVEGDRLRDWSIDTKTVAWFPYTGQDLRVSASDAGIRRLWPIRTLLRNRIWFRQTQQQRGLKWFEYGHISRDKMESPLCLAFPFVASHNHFILSENRSVFNRSSPVVQFNSNVSEDSYFALLGYLNSSVVCFWMKQVSHQKQLTGGDGVRVEAIEKVPYEFATKQIQELPIPGRFWNEQHQKTFAKLSRQAYLAAGEIVSSTADAAIEVARQSGIRVDEAWERELERRQRLLSKLVQIQEELDFQSYALFDFVDISCLGISEIEDCQQQIVRPGERPFEIMAQESKEGFVVPKTTPTSWPVTIRSLWERRIAAVNNSSTLRILEAAHYKRRWIGRQGLFNRKRDTNEVKEAFARWLTNRLESYFDFDCRLNISRGQQAALNVELCTLAKLADIARGDVEFMEVGTLYRDDPAFEIRTLLEELVVSESVPHLPVMRYKASGLRKRAEWDRVWTLQREEDRGIDVGKVPVPPKYDGKDFLTSDIGRLRGKLDLPKERWISFPHCEGPDGTLVICWAGYDHLQQAQAISAYYVRVQTEFGGSDDPRLIPLLASLIELLPWLKQWHNEPNANFDGLRMGDYFEGFVNEEARALGKTLDEIRAWSPPKGQRGRVAKGQSKGKRGRDSKTQSGEAGAES